MSTNLTSAGVLKEAFTKKVKSKNRDVKKMETKKTANIPEEMYLPNGLHGYFNLEAAKKCAKIQNKTILLSFMSNKSQKYKKMNLKVFRNPTVIEIVKECFVVLVLCVNDKIKLPAKEGYRSKFNGKLIKTIGAENTDYQYTKFFNTIQPFYVIIDRKENRISDPKGYDLNVNNFITFLENGIRSFKAEKEIQEIVEEKKELQEVN